MTIEFVGNTAADFLADAVAAGLYSTTATDHRDTGMVPNDMAVFIEGGSSAPFSITLDAETDDVWVHFRVLTDKIQSSGASGYWLQFFNDSADELGRIDFAADDVTAVAYADSTDTGAEIENWPNDNMTIDVHLKRTGTTSIACDLYKDGSLVSSASAANTGNLAGTKTITFANFDVTQTDGTWKYSEFIVTSGGESTLGWRLGCIEPDGVGNHADFEGNHVELGDDDLATAAATDTATDRVSSSLTYGGPTTSAGIRSIIAKCVATKGDTGPTQMKQFLRLSATNYDGSTEALTIDNAAYMEEWLTNPNTTLAWDSADLASIEVGVLAVA